MHAGAYALASRNGHSVSRAHEKIVREYLKRRLPPMCDLNEAENQVHHKHRRAIATRQIDPERWFEVLQGIARNQVVKEYTLWRDDVASTDAMQFLVDRFLGQPDRETQEGITRNMDIKAALEYLTSEGFLCPEHVEALFLRHVMGFTKDDGFSEGQIAKAMRIPKERVPQLLKEACRALKEHLRRNGYEEGGSIDEE
jgi:hypothetical protein